MQLGSRFNLVLDRIDPRFNVALYTSYHNIKVGLIQSGSSFNLALHSFGLRFNLVDVAPDSIWPQIQLWPRLIGSQRGRKNQHFLVAIVQYLTGQSRLGGVLRKSCRKSANLAQPVEITKI